MTAKFHWLICGQVYTTHPVKQITNARQLNVVLITDDICINRKGLAQAQDSLMRRFVTECPQIPGFKISDVVIESVALLGQMSSEQFNEGFEKPETATAPQSSGSLN